MNKSIMRYSDYDNAIEYNTDIERKRQEEHLCLCKQSESYKRVYECYQNKDLRKQICDANQIFLESLKQDNAKVTAANKAHKTQRYSNSYNSLDKSLLYFMFVMLFNNKDKQRQMDEDIKSSKIIAEVNRKYDNLIVRKSGFER